VIARQEMARLEKGFETTDLSESVFFFGGGVWYFFFRLSVFGYRSKSILIFGLQHISG